MPYTTHWAGADWDAWLPGTCQMSRLFRWPGGLPRQMQGIIYPPTGGVHPLKIFRHTNNVPIGDVKSSYMHVP